MLDAGFFRTHFLFVYIFRIRNFTSYKVYTKKTRRKLLNSNRLKHISKKIPDRGIWKKVDIEKLIEIKALYTLFFSLIFHERKLVSFFYSLQNLNPLKFE